MMKLRLKQDYPNQFWNSGTGFTIAKDDRVGREANEDDHIIKAALDQGFLEIVPEGESLNIITDDAPKDTIKEVVGKESSKELRERLTKMKADSVMKPVNAGPEPAKEAPETPEPEPAPEPEPEPKKEKVKVTKKKTKKKAKEEPADVRGEPTNQEDPV